MCLTTYNFEAFDATCYLFCRGGQIRTDDLLLPKQTRYRATLHPEGVIWECKSTN